MSLTDDEANSAFKILSDAMQQVGFNWVINQVEEKLALGKVQAKKIQAREYPEPTVSLALADQPMRLATKPTSAVFAVSERFSPQERLGVLLDGIDLAVPVVGEVAEQVFKNLESFGNSASVEFAPEADITEEFTLSVEDVLERSASRAHLRALVDELRRAMSDAN
jgi:hypothetical protein